MVAAIIILYHPDLSLLRRLLESIADQVEGIIAVDNTPRSFTELHSFFESFPHPVSYVPLGDNMGIATAQNIGIQRAINEGCSHILLLDQDSIPSPHLVESLLRAEQSLVNSGARVAAVGPLYIDQKTQSLSYAIRYAWFNAKKVYIEPSSLGPVEADWLISSGSLIQSAAFAEVGLMSDDLFIDWVDTEWGLRARSIGFKSFIVPDAVMEHSVGDASRVFLGHSFNLHSTTRNYYIVRNATYLLRPKSMGWRWVTAMILRIPRYVAVHTWYSEDRRRSLSVMIRAIVDGLCGRLGPIAD